MDFIGEKEMERNTIKTLLKTTIELIEKKHPELAIGLLNQIISYHLEETDSIQDVSQLKKKARCYHYLTESALKTVDSSDGQKLWSFTSVIRTGDDVDKDLNAAVMRKAITEKLRLKEE
jgi:hypothetical protein